MSHLKEKARLCTALLKAEYPDALCSLEAPDPFQLLVSVRLAAQCTDARVNLVTPALFARFPTPQAMALADVAEVEGITRSCGFFRTKAADLVAMSRQLCERHGGQVPERMEDLTALQGVGRKSANLIRGDVFGLPAVVADTHLIRISNLLGLVSAKDPYQVELQLEQLLEPPESNDFCHRCVLHGRAVCVARRPQCGKCVLHAVCDGSVTSQGPASPPPPAPG
ncbi:MAG: endonuclease III [Oscillospiraceae bacterium]|jgi:endonuclease-3|nr:endonuclease III [Oscillospiraceae bacterium]